MRGGSVATARSPAATLAYTPAVPPSRAHSPALTPRDRLPRQPRPVSAVSASGFAVDAHMCESPAPRLARTARNSLPAAILFFFFFFFPFSVPRDTPSEEQEAPQSASPAPLRTSRH